MVKIEYVTKAEFARRMNLSKPTITNLIKRGRLSQTKSGRINFAKGKKEIETNRAANPDAAAIKQGTIDPAIIKTRRRQEEIKLELAEMELRERRGELIERAEVLRMAKAVISISRSRFLNIPQKMAPKLVGLTSIRKIKSILEKEIYAALKELSQVKEI